LRNLPELLKAIEDIGLQSYSGYVYRLVPYKYRTSLLSTVGAQTVGGRYSPAAEFGVLYTCDSPLTANLEVAALFVDPAGQLVGAARDPDLMLTLRCELSRVVDLRAATVQAALGTNHDEIVLLIPSRHILNARKQLTPTQILGKACYITGKISALIAPSAASTKGFCLNIFPDRLVKGELVSILDSQGSPSGQIAGESE
jgi:RES domain-containing protein